MTPLAPDLAEVLSQVSAGNRLAFASLYARTNVRLYGVIVRLLPNNNLAGDVLQEAYVRIWQNAIRFDPKRGEPIVWMKSIARHKALDELRRLKALPIVYLGEDFDPAVEDFDPLASRERSESLNELMYCLSKLDARTRELIMLAYYRGMSREALSKRFGAPVPTIKTQLRRGLVHLKGLLESVPNSELAFAERAHLIGRNSAVLKRDLNIDLSHTQPRP